MNHTYERRFSQALIATALSVALSGCGLVGRQAPATSEEDAPQVSVTEQRASSEPTSNATPQTVVEPSSTSDETSTSNEATSTGVVTSIEGMASDGVIDTTDLFSDRDLAQEADLSNAVNLTVTSGQDLLITEAGTYVLSGEAQGSTVIVNLADSDSDKVQLVLDGLTITNQESPAIYVISADKVFVTTTEGSNNALTVTNAFVADGETNTDAVIFSKDDLVLNGLGTLTINSSDNGISCKDDLKVTGGTYVITCASDALEANDSIRIADGSITITSQKDGLHAENDEDDSLGYIYICGGSLHIEAGSDGIQATTYLQVDGGTIDVSAGEGLEATYIQINGGDISVSAWDDGVNASFKSASLGIPAIDIRGGNISVTMGQGDTDALDSNGYLYVRGGTVDIYAQFAFDFDYGAEYTGGTIYVNGEQVSEITESMMGPGGFGGPGW